MTLRDAAQQALHALELDAYGVPTRPERNTAINALRAALTETCTWTQDDEGAMWETECEQLFDIIDGTPSDNAMKFCCYCGKQIDEIDYVKEVADDNA